MSWQDYLALALVFAAAGYIIRRAWLAVFSTDKTGCGSGCGKCSVSQINPHAAPLLRIEDSRLR